MKVDDLCQPSMVYRHPKQPQTCLKDVQDTLTMKKLTSEQLCKAPGTKSIWEAWKLLTAWHDCGSTDIRPCPGMLVEVVLCGRAQLQIWDNIPRCHVLPCHRIEAPHLHTTHHHGPGLHASHVPVGRAL